MLGTPENLAEREAWRKQRKIILTIHYIAGKMIFIHRKTTASRLEKRHRKVDYSIGETN